MSGEVEYATVRDEREAMLYRAFVEHRADYITITSRRAQRQIESAEYGVDRGWLKKTVDDFDEQSTAWIYRLTPKGRKYLFRFIQPAA